MLGVDGGFTTTDGFLLRWYHGLELRWEVMVRVSWHWRAAESRLVSNFVSGFCKSNGAKTLTQRFRD